MPSCPPGQTYDRTLKACRDKKRPGRKTQKVPCESTQTYNRTLKACRDKKKPGRKAAAAVAASPKARTPSPKARTPSPSPKKDRATFEFSAQLIHNGPWNDEIATRVLKWYRDFAPDFKELPNLTIEHVKGHHYRASFTIPTDAHAHYDPKLEAQMFVDLDEDGNYPIKVNRRNYLVLGQVTSFNGDPVTE